MLATDDKITNMKTMKEKMHKLIIDACFSFEARAF